MRFTYGHNCYFVRDLEKSVDFYQNKLGLKLMFRQEVPSHNMTIVYLRLTKGQFIELIGDMPHAEKNGSFLHLCLHVDDIYATHREITEKGLNPTPVENGSSNCIKFYLDDPDGNTIEMMQLLPESLQTIHDHD